MKCPALLFLVLAASLALPNPSDARIGESLGTIERRLFASGGIIYRDKDLRKPRRNAGPYQQYLEYLGSSAEVRVYFKTDNGRQPRQSEVETDTLGNGWEVHVLYISGKSVFELYKRVGSITEQETNALLLLLGDGGYWDKPEPLADEEEAPPSVFGFDYVRNDGEVLAKKSAGGIMVFKKQLDEFLAKQHESNLQNKAPDSVRGF